ncbi:MAG: hypothetical protein NT062_21980 [Proteobacteria bacterium]|nr:hypothetical protein [Pseudomonadota bacterium]
MNSTTMTTGPATSTEPLSTWDDVRQLVDELQLKMHLAGMEVHDRWEALQPRISELEARMTRAGHAVTTEVTSLGQTLRKLRDDLVRAVS